MAWPVYVTERKPVHEKGADGKTEPTPGSWRRVSEVREKLNGHLGESGATLRSAAVGSCSHPGPGGTKMTVVVLPEPRCELDPRIKCSRSQRHVPKRRREGRSPRTRGLRGGHLWHRAEPGRALWVTGAQHRAGQWQVGPSKVWLSQIGRQAPTEE